MFDGNGGINYSGIPSNLFFRDPGYISSTIEGEKNIWARGTGWVMAAFARIFEYIPEDWEHYNYFYGTYLDMADTCIRCVKEDNEGRMYWTQSMIPKYPVSSENPFGYETSGTPFITYSLFYGLNNELLPENCAYYAENCLRYLTEVAIQESGFVGYIQPIGSAATTTVNSGSNYNFGVGATISALCEAARYYGGMDGNVYPYLTRKMMGSAAVKIGVDAIYRNGERYYSEAAFIDENGYTLISVRPLIEAIGAEKWSGMKVRKKF